MSVWPLRLMVYGAGEAVNGANQLAPEIQAQLGRLMQVCTNRYVAATAQLDASDVPTLRWVLDPAGRQQVVQLPNVDVGDPGQLVDFVSWSTAICPAARSVVVLSGHGAAWEDSMVDDVLGIAPAPLTRGPTSPPAVPGAIHHARRLFGTGVSQTKAVVRSVLIDGHDRDYLSNAELGAASDQIAARLGGKLDVLVFDACLMSSWEILQELGDSVRTVVGSIDELSAAGIDVATAAQQLSNAHGAADANAIATAIVAGFRPQAAFDSCVAVDLDRPDWNAGLAAFAAFCATLLPWVQNSAANAQAVIAALRSASSSVVQFSGGGLADVQALADAVSRLPGLPSDAATSVQTAARALSACVLGKAAGQDYQAAMGVSVFAPGSATVYASNRSDYTRLRFSTLTGWGAVLEALFNVAPGGTRTPLPAITTTTAPAAVDAEFVVTIRGVALTDAVQQRIELAVRRATLVQLAQVDQISDVNIAPPAAAVRLVSNLGHPGTRGLWVNSNGVAATRAVVQSAAPLDLQITTTPNQVDFRVVLHGLSLDEGSRAAIDSAIRIAALAEIATIDNLGDQYLSTPAQSQQTRSLIGQPPWKILGLVIDKLSRVA
jgi:hypothetical protein